MINVLVTSLGSNTAIGVIKALRQQKEICITGTDIFTAKQSAGSPLVDYFLQVPMAIADDYEYRLLEIIKEKNIHCVIPIHDVEVEKVSFMSVKYPAQTFWAVNPPGIISLCNDKKMMNRFLSNRQINVPEMYDAVEKISCPAIYKPNKGVSSKGILVIESAEESRKNFDLENGFLQKMIKGDEYTVDCYTSYHSNFFNCCVRKRIETKEGISTKGVTVDFPLLEEIAAKIHKGLQYKGASNIQFIVENGIPYFIEMNPRFSGAGILSYHAGLNSPLFTTYESVQSPLFNDAKNTVVKKGVYMTRYWNENFYEG